LRGRVCFEYLIRMQVIKNDSFCAFIIGGVFKLEKCLLETAKEQNLTILWLLALGAENACSS